MDLEGVLKEELKRQKISDAERKDILNIARTVVKSIESKIKKKNIDASVFIGGSVAKNTLVRQDERDIDIFLRFNKKYSEEDIKKLMKKIFFFFSVKGFSTKIKKIHGSRDYVQIKFNKNKINVEIVPSVRISKPEEARNVTDLSYFHVSYINSKLSKSKKLSDEIILAKAFCHAQKCYGAESYVNGFSGYVIELLVIHYGSFVKFLQGILSSDKLIIDSSKSYENDKTIITGLNKSKTLSPIILIDPTFKERNVASSLSEETFSRFKKAAKAFLEHPSADYFEYKMANKNDFIRHAKEHEGEFYLVKIKTKHQEGDIAGTKLLKFSKIFEEHVIKYFYILKKEFEYLGGSEAYLYLVINKKKEIISVGPKLEYKEAVENFKKAHPIWYVDNGYIKYSQSGDLNFKKVLKDFYKNNKKMIREMGITDIKII